MVILESHLTKLEVAFGKRIIFNAANIFNLAKGFIPVQALALVEVKNIFQ